MGGCCSKNEVGEGLPCKKEEDGEDDDGDEGELFEGDGDGNGGGARVGLRGTCEYASMFTQQGWKGVNQDAMTIWEGIGGDKSQIFCGVFDGHGPFGHHVASLVRDTLPSKLYALLSSTHSIDQVHECDHLNESSWNSIFVRAFEDMDTDLKSHPFIDCICSGTTAVSIFKTGNFMEHLIIANLGDSRAVLCTRDDRNLPIPVQLTTDLKPNLPSEAERIKSCRGRVFALEEEPDVYRIWLPDEDSPGLAMARAFGDFCLKDFGLISTPQIAYRKLSEKDEFVVLATDGVWDVLSNKEVVKIVSSVPKQSDAARHLVQCAVRAWRRKHPTSKIDDCAAICLFLKLIPSSSRAKSFETPRSSTKSCELSFSESFRTARSEETIGAEAAEEEIYEECREHWNALEGVTRANSVLRLPRLASVLNWRKRSTNAEENED
uniref:protein-serine/threonine phosphatase n=1 Tax=Ananas comosus var. bracteatus TaxID=296719 RepID=A0A6V7NGS3_ANACO|nr:unnamed protein product [Ananas comosus var. bracteatus]